MRALIITVSSVVLAACYTPNQSQLDDWVSQQIAVGMPLSVAITKLSREGFLCSGSNPVDCARSRQRILPSTCIERVRLSHAASAVDKIDTSPIRCAGL
jgi:hypothetical protein